MVKLWHIESTQDVGKETYNMKWASLYALECFNLTELLLKLLQFSHAKAIIVKATYDSKRYIIAPR